MATGKHTICRESLAEVQAEAKRLGVFRPLSVYMRPIFDSYGVSYRSQDRWKEVWTGQACCRWHARAQALQMLIDGAPKGTT